MEEITNITKNFANSKRVFFILTNVSTAKYMERSNDVSPDNSSVSNRDIQLAAHFIKMNIACEKKI